MAIGQETLNEINRQIESGQLFLPSLPDSMAQIRAVLNDPDASSAQISAALASDPGLAARILKVANSAMIRGRQEIENLQQAVGRLGNRLLNTLVTSHHLMQLISNSQQQQADYTRYLYQHSLRVAAYSYAIARQLPDLDPDDALLAGLVHDIGYLPLVTLLPPDNKTELQNNLNAIRHEKTYLTVRLLHSWRFSDSLVKAAREHGDYTRSPGEADLTDVVTVAELNALRDESNAENENEWAQIGAFTRIGIDPTVPLESLPSLEQDLSHAKTMLGIQ